MQINKKLVTPLSFALLIFAIRLLVMIFINRVMPRSSITELLVIIVVPFVLGYISGTKFSVILSKYFIIKTALIDALLQIIAVALVLGTELIVHESPFFAIGIQAGLAFVLDLIFLYLGNYLSLPKK